MVQYSMCTRNVIKNILPLPTILWIKISFFTYIYNTFGGHSVLSYLQMVYFSFSLLYNSLSCFQNHFSKVYSLYCSLPHTQFFKYTDIFYLLLNKETFIFFKTEAMKQMGITLCENGN